ncbi:MAG: pyrroline-5-carboxylate reductase [Faecousia sp.]
MKYGFIGCGNMGSSIAKAISQKTSSIMVSDLSGKAKALGYAYGTPQEAAATADRLFLAVKPQRMGAVLEDLQPALQEKKPLLITMAAGLTMEKISAMAGGDYPIIRIMPNTSVAIGKGVTLYCRNGLVSDEILADFLEDMSASGEMVALEERLFDAGTSLSGCGPAYCYLFLEAMADGAVACGIPRETALRLAAATMEGSGAMVRETGKHPAALRDAVCSPGGSTIAGVMALEAGGARNAAIAAVTAACKRNQELGK